MICKNCSAKISDDVLLCPYCGTENLKVAQKEQQDYIDAYERKKRKLKKVPEKVVKKTTKGLLYGVGITVGIIMLAILVIIAFSGLTKGDEMAKQEKELAKLEEYYASGDYESMSKYYEKLGKWGGSYEKYKRVSGVYSSMDWHLEMLKSDTSYVKTIDLDATHVEEHIEWCLEPLAKIYEWEEMDFPYGEKEGALYVKEKYMDAFQTYTRLTEVEIKNAILMYIDGERDYMELAEIAIQRMEEHFR